MNYTRLQFLKSCGPLVLVPVLAFNDRLKGAGAWQLSFDKVHDVVEVHLGGPEGQLIRWDDRGFGGQYTWSWKDPLAEVRSIAPWVGDGDRIKLWAKVWTMEGGTGDHQCDMNTLYDGVRKQRWEFDEDEDHEIGR